MSDRKTFPVLGGNGARIDWQLVLDHGEQAQKNHGQTLTGLASRGGLSWDELYAVLYNKRWQKIDTNEAIIACRTIEANYLGAVCADPPLTNAQLMADELVNVHIMADPRVKALVDALELIVGEECERSSWYQSKARTALAQLKEPKP